MIKMFFPHLVITPVVVKKLLDNEKKKKMKKIMKKVLTKKITNVIINM